MKRTRLWAVVAGIALFLAMGVSARADSASFTINVPNSGLSGTPGPYATVDLSLNGSGGIDVTVTMLSTFNMFGHGEGGGAFGFNVDGAGLPPGFAVSTPVANAGYSGAALSVDLGGGQMDGFGNFDVTIQDGTPNQNLTSMTFTVTRTSGFSTVQDLVDASCGGEFCGAHFVVHVSPGAGVPTGFAGDTGTTEVPEPATLTLLGTGLLGLAGVIRRRLSR